MPSRPRRPMGRARPGGVPDAARREQLRARVAASRAAQGTPPYVTDEATLGRIADLLVVMLGRRDTRGRRIPRSVGSAWPGVGLALVGRGRRQAPGGEGGVVVAAGARAEAS
jgi:hypothetical protein